MPLAVPCVETVPLLPSQCAIAVVTVCHCCRHSVPLLPPQCATAVATVCHCCRHSVPLLPSQCVTAAVTVCHCCRHNVPLLPSQCATAAATVCHCCRHSVSLLPSQCATAAVTMCHCCRHSVHCCRHSVLLLPCAVGSIRLQQPGPHGCRATAAVCRWFNTFTTARPSWMSCHCCRVPLVLYVYNSPGLTDAVPLPPCAVGSIRLQQPWPLGCRAPANSFSNSTFNCGPFLALLLCAK